MNIDGLNQEQIDYIMNEFKNEDFIPNDEIEFMEGLTEGDHLEYIDHDEHRHWTEVVAIVEIGNRFFGFPWIIGMGDMDICDTGWEQPNEVHEYVPIEKTITTFLKKLTM